MNGDIIKIRNINKIKNKSYIKEFHEHSELPLVKHLSEAQRNFQ